MNTNLIIHMIGKINEKTNRFLMKELENQGFKGISPSHGDILGILCMTDSVQMKDIAEFINRDKSTVTSLVNKLVGLGYIEKKASPDDNRVTLICLTDKGKALKPNIMEISNNLMAKAHKGISDTERILFMDLLIKLYKNF